MLFRLPVIFAQFDALSLETDLTLLRAGLYDVVAQFLEIESRLQAFYETFNRSVSGPVYWPVLSTVESNVDDEEAGKLFPVWFRFPSFSVALTVVTYWSNSMVVHNQLGHAYDRLERLPPCVDDGCFPVFSSAYAEVPAGGGRNLKWEVMAKNICQSVEYFSQECMGSLGPLVILSFLAGCYSCFGNTAGDWSREMRWVADAMVRVKRRLGFATGNLLGG